MWEEMQVARLLKWLYGINMFPEKETHSPDQLPSSSIQS